VSEGLRVYLERLFGVWRDLAGPGQLGLQLLAFALLVVVTVRFGRTGVWTWRTTLGALATVVLFHLNLAVMPLLLLVRDGFQAGVDGLGLPQLADGVWAGSPWLAALVGVVAFDFADYWCHRALHLRWLWPIHAIHHSDPDVNGLTAFRVHALEPFVMSCTYALLLTWLNLPAEALGAMATVLVLHKMYVHADLDWTHGPLEPLIASPRYHRWHHADVAEAHGKNLAGVIPLWDRAFGTYHCPGRCDARVGVAGAPEHNPLALCLYPFAAWLALIREAVGRWWSRSPRGSAAALG
jgi:sterol desaturase/sphingolipid hydroxylase (fatty acid hydroxylase superfamily)